MYFYLRYSVFPGLIFKDKYIWYELIMLCRKHKKIYLVNFILSEGEIIDLEKRGSQIELVGGIYSGTNRNVNKYGILKRIKNAVVVFNLLTIQKIKAMELLDSYIKILSSNGNIIYLITEDPGDILIKFNNYNLFILGKEQH